MGNKATYLGLRQVVAWGVTDNVLQKLIQLITN